MNYYLGLLLKFLTKEKIQDTGKLPKISFSDVKFPNVKRKFS